jgi:outer membrane murein-binding lipoprotein Lpp
MRSRSNPSRVTSSIRRRTPSGRKRGRTRWRRFTDRSVLSNRAKVNLVPQAFLNGRPVVADRAAGHELDPASELASAIAVPLGDNGVLLAGSTDTEALDEITTEVADLLAATAEAAFDRVRREGELRDRDRELRRRNRRLSRLNRINDVIREIDGVLVGADTREEIEYAVCERLTTSDRFDFA